MTIAELLVLEVAIAVAAFAYDFAIARWAVAVAGADDADVAAARRSAHRAARWSVVIYVVGLVGVLGVLKISLWLVIGEGAGLYAGTYFGSTWGRFRDVQSREKG